MTDHTSEPVQSWKRSLGLKRYAFRLAALWTLLIVLLGIWNARREMNDQRELVQNIARTHFLKDQAFRLWASQHGGVYVTPTEHTPPNPYLSHLPDRDVETTTGAKLTLMNPAYMVRQMMEDFHEMYGFSGHITSLKPLRPENEPDPWERSALESFEKGKTEFSEFTEIDGAPYLRLMRPMLVEVSCLKCHAHQGYVEGDIRGGVGVSIPAGPSFVHARENITYQSWALSLLWLIGVTGLALGSIHLQRRVSERDEAEQTLVRRAEFERLFSEISSGLAALGTEQLDKGIERALAQIGAASGADRAYVFLFKDDGIHLANTHEWCAPGVVAERDHLQNVDVNNELPWFSQFVHHQETFHVPDVSALPPEAHLERAHFEAQDIQSLIAVPMESEGRLLGFLGIDAVRTRRIWTDDDQAVLRLVSENFAHLIERKRAEQARQKSEHAYRRLFDNSPVSIWHEDFSDLAARMKELREQGVSDLRGFLDGNPGELLLMVEAIKIIDVNECSVEMFGALDKKHLVENLAHPFDEKALDIFKEEVIAIWEGKESFESEAQVRTLDGRSIDILLRMHTGTAGDESDMSRVIVTMTNITERKRAEEEKLEFERQMQHAQKLESLGVLAGGIAHDFNNLLTIILGHADLALDELSPMSPARNNIGEIESACKRAADLAKQMLAYSGRGRFIVEPIDAGELIEEMAHLLKVSISKKVTLKLNLAKALPSFDGDVTQIRQVIMNLITNASEAIGDDSGTIALSTGMINCNRACIDETDSIVQIGMESPMSEGIYTYFEVEDTGCGMDEETTEKIFDPFFTTKFTGRGLGMSAVLGIVRGHKGGLKMQSDVGTGTKFTLFFPANQSHDDPAQIPISPSKKKDIWRGSGTVLIADDEESVCAVGKQMLERLGFDVLTAPDGREALNVFRAHSEEIVCVLLDLTMPHMDGEEAFRELRHLDSDIPVILCSGFSEYDATQRFAGKNLAGFVQKPFDKASLRTILAKILPDATGN